MCKPNQLGIRSIKTHDLTKSSNTHTHSQPFTCPLIEELTVTLLQKPVLEQESQKAFLSFVYTKYVIILCEEWLTRSNKHTVNHQNMMLKPRFSRASTFYNLLLSLPLVSYLYLLIFFLNDCGVTSIHLIWSLLEAGLAILHCSSYYVKVG